ncbi:hypothetical protein F0330_26390 [Klebsiella pneumoniae]|nr:hypothetical protein F0330_26390 [Klebsiella pneumoniae]HBZ1007617.1 hypothetical protein [Klebsiella pneumoniae]
MQVDVGNVGSWHEVDKLPELKVRYERGAEVRNSNYYMTNLRSRLSLTRKSARIILINTSSPAEYPVAEEAI